MTAPPPSPYALRQMAQQRFVVSYHSDRNTFEILDRNQHRVVATFTHEDNAESATLAHNLCRYCYAGVLNAAERGEL